MADSGHVQRVRIAAARNEKVDVRSRVTAIGNPNVATEKPESLSFPHVSPVSFTVTGFGRSWSDPHEKGWSTVDTCIPS